MGLIAEVYVALRRVEPVKIYVFLLQTDLILHFLLITGI